MRLVLRSVVATCTTIGLSYIVTGQLRCIRCIRSLLSYNAE